MMKNIFAIVNQKGGVGKTTTVLNLATALVQRRKKVLVIDIDPQANTTTGAGIEKNEIQSSVYDILVNGMAAREVILKSPSCKFDLIPANRHLAGAEIELVQVLKREYQLKLALSEVAGEYDFIFIDCPPSLSLLTLNALTCAAFVLVPIQCEYYALEGLTDLLNTINLLKAQLNPSLQLFGIVRTMYDKRNKLAQQVSQQLLEYFAEKVFYVAVPRTVRLAEAPSFGTSAVAMDVATLGAQAYVRMARELIKRWKEII